MLFFIKPRSLVLIMKEVPVLIMYDLTYRVSSSPLSGSPLSSSSRGGSAASISPSLLPKQKNNHPNMNRWILTSTKNKASNHHQHASSASSLSPERCFSLIVTSTGQSTETQDLWLRGFEFGSLKKKASSVVFFTSSRLPRHSSKVIVT